MENDEIIGLVNCFLFLEHSIMQVKGNEGLWKVIKYGNIKKKKKKKGEYLSENRRALSLISKKATCPN